MPGLKLGALRRSDVRSRIYLFIAAAAFVVASTMTIGTVVLKHILAQPVAEQRALTIAGWQTCTRLERMRVWPITYRHDELVPGVDGGSTLLVQVTLTTPTDRGALLTAQIGKAQHLSFCGRQPRAGGSSETAS